MTRIEVVGLKKTVALTNGKTNTVYTLTAYKQGPTEYLVSITPMYGNPTDDVKSGRHSVTAIDHNEAISKIETLLVVE
jgi:hypothetical protein